MNSIEFIVPGALPGWQRAGQNGKRHYTQSQTRTAKTEVAAWCRQAMAGRPMLTGALALDVVVYRAVPASWSPKRQREAMAGTILPTTKPDCDNHGKLVADALNGVAYHDDAQIADLRVCKRYAETALVRVTVRQINDPHSARILLTPKA